MTKAAIILLALAAAPGAAAFAQAQPQDRGSAAPEGAAPIEARPAVAEAGSLSSAASQSGAVPEVVVTADRAGLLERAPTSSIFGVSKPLLETPRAATFISDTTLERYGVVSIDDLVAISPSSYTASFYGVPGSLNIRGTLAEDYFDGFKRVENRGTYATPIGDAAEIEIVRGPPSPAFGPGKVGGLLNFIPKTGSDNPVGLESYGPSSGELSLTGGSYDKKEATADASAPFDLFGHAGSVHAYLDADDSHSFYRGVYPKRQTGELALRYALPQGWTSELQTLVFHSDGDVQTAGWNRLTQNLIDTGAYQAGRNTTLVDLNGDGRIEAGEPGAYPYGGQYANLICYYAGCTNPVHQLTQNIAPARLSTRTVDVSYADTSKTMTYTTYAGLSNPAVLGGAVKLEMFYDALSNERFVSYGFPASYQTAIVESRLSYTRKDEGLGGALTAQTLVGVGDRYTDAHLRESYNSGIIAIDRRDLYEGASATDIIASPFDTVDGKPGFPWELDVHSNIRDAGAFVTSDLALGRFDLIVGGREDDFNVSSGDRGVLSYEAGGVDFAHADRARGSYSASLSYKAPLGIIPYYTFDKASALELDQASDLLPGTIGASGGGGFVSTSYLSEVGVKAQSPSHALTGSLSLYRQTRSDLVQGLGSDSLVGTLSKGAELEIRFLATPQLSFTFAGDLQHTEVKGPDASFVYLPPSVFGVAGIDGYGGSYAGAIDSLPGRGGDYLDALIPHAVASFYATYASDPSPQGRGGATVGVTHVSKTATLVQDPIVYPDYWLCSASAFFQRGVWRVSGNVDNVFNERYFTPNSDPTYANVSALPGVGRTWRVTLLRRF